MSDGQEEPSTRERLLSVAMTSFAMRGYEATSLDGIAEECGVRKQTLLYYYPSKEALLGAVIEQTVATLGAVIRPAAHGHRDNLGSVVDALFRIGAQRPELLDLVREVLRLGPPASDLLVRNVDPLVAELASTVSRDAVLTTAAIVVGMATEVEVLRALGIDPTLRELRRRRRIVRGYLQRAITS